MDTFEKSIFFRFFFEFLQNSISRLHWARKFRKKIPQASLDTFGKVFRDFGTLKSFRFSWIFLSLLCALGTAFSVEKLNQNILKQCFWEHFRTILKVSKFLLFLKFFPSLDPPRCTGDFFSKQNYLKTGSEHVWTILGTVLDTLEIMKFSIFSNLSLTRPSRVQCAKFLPKNLPRNKFKTCLIAFGNVFWAFWKNESFPVFWSYSTCRPSRVHWAFLFQKTYLKTSWKLVWTILGTFSDTFEIPKLFRFFSPIFSKFRSPGCPGQEKNGRKNNSNQVWTFLETFSGILKVWKFIHFLKFFEFSTLQGALGEIFYRKKHLEACWKHVWTLLGTYLGILKKWKFSSFLKFFPGWTFQCALGNFFWEDYLKTSSKLVWTLLRTFWTLLRNQFFFDFSSNFYKIRSPGCTGQENFGKKYLKQVWTLLERFFGILELWNLLDFRGFFWVSCVHWEQRFPSKNSIKTFSNNVFGNIFGQFWKFRSFCFF